jgi:hypothetical protein
MFTDSVQKLNGLRIGKPVTVIFPFNDIIRISSVNVPCDCTAVSWDQNVASGNITVRYTPKDVPPHLKQQGHKGYRTQKMFVVQYVSTIDPGHNSTITLMFHGEVKE